jgi:two-component system response regulator MprA
VNTPDEKLVLVVDDEPSIREAIADMLGFEGYAVVTAANGAEALERVRSCTPAAVLLDLMMPVMNGWDFLEACRNERLCSDTPVLVMSAYHRLTEESPNLGARACIAKPFDIEVLLGAVERLVQRAA